MYFILENNNLNLINLFISLFITLLILNMKILLLKIPKIIIDLLINFIEELIICFSFKI